MTTTSEPAELPSAAMSDEAYGALRASAALWAGASVLITNERGEVLIQRVDYRDTCLLPGGGVDPGESPAHAAARELQEELGVSAVMDRGLVVDWISPHHATAPRGVRFPGEILHVFDGGTWGAEQIAAIRLPGHEITGVEFAEPARLPDLLSPGDARRALSALRARINAAGTVLLEDGLPIAPTVLDRLAVLRTPRPTYHFPWHPAPTPHATTAVQVWAWAFTPSGRVLILIDPETGAAVLPGGTPEDQDHGDPISTLLREADEEATARLERPLYLGHITDPTTRRGYLRYAAELRAVGHLRPDPASGRTYTRILMTPEQALTLFDWGPPADDQLAAVHQARERLGLPRAAAQPVTELTDPTSW